MIEPNHSNNQKPTEPISSPKSELGEVQSTEAPGQLDGVSTDAQQAEYRKAYIEQLRRMSCPGCGEDPTLPF